MSARFSEQEASTNNLNTTNTQLRSELDSHKDENKRLHAQIDEMTKATAIMTKQKAEVEELYWNNLVLLLKLSASPGDVRWNRTSSLWPRVIEEKIPYVDWTQFVLTEVEGDDAGQRATSRPQNRSNSSKSPSQQHRTKK